MMIDNVRAHVQSTLKVKRSPRTRVHVDRADRIVKILFSNEEVEDSYAYKVLKDGRREERPWLRDVKEYLALVEISATGESDLSQYCWVAEGSHEAVMMLRTVGSPCCDCRQDSVALATSATLNFLCVLAWEVTDVARWTYVLKLLKRFC